MILGLSAYGTVRPSEERRSMAAPPPKSDIDLLGDGEGVVNFDAQVPDGTFDLRMAEE